MFIRYNRKFWISLISLCCYFLYDIILFIYLIPHFHLSNLEDYILIWLGFAISEYFILKKEKPPKPKPAKAPKKMPVLESQTLPIVSRRYG
jgi:hypothetical protein